MKISACVIVKNEAANMAQWLENMQPLADDIVVVDTGSTDNTVEIARSYGVEPYYFAWCNDFAAAKNYALSQAKGDWILFLDADEYFTQDSSRRLREILGRYHRDRKIGAILCRLIDIDRDKMNRVIDSMLQVRIFRNSSRIHYVGAVHEQLHTDGGYTMQFCKELEIYHTGYSSSLMRKKAERNLEILQKQYEETKDPRKRSQLYCYFMDVYHSLEQYDKMLEYAKLTVESGFRVLGDSTKVYQGIITAMLGLNMDRSEIMAALDDALEKFPGSTLFLAEKGIFYYVDKAYLKAEKLMEEALASHRQVERQMAQGQGTTDSALHIMPQLYAMLADIYIMKGNLSRAKEMALKGLSYHKYHAMLTRCLYKSLAHGDLVDTIQQFNGIYDKMQDSDYLVDTLSDICQPQFGAYYGRNCQGLNKLKVLLKTGNYVGAAALAARKLQIYENLTESPQQGN